MRSTSLSIAMIFSAHAAIANAVECTDNAFKVTTPLPGWPAESPQEWPCQYAGTLNGNEDGTDQLFFWMFKNPSEDAD